MTPAHQFPTGVVLSAERRAALIAWAERGDRLIIEDDYDAELCDRAGRRAAGPRAGPRPLHRLGEQAADAGDAARLDAPAVVALVGADLREGDRGCGLGGRRSARPRRLHRPRRARPPPAAHAAALRAPARRADRRARARAAGVAPSASSAAGCYVLVELPAGVDEPALLAAAARARRRASRACRCTATRATARPAWCSATRHLAEPAIERGVRLLREALAALT